MNHRSVLLFTVLVWTMKLGLFKTMFEFPLTSNDLCFGLAYFDNDTDELSIHLLIKNEKFRKATNYY